MTPYAIDEISIIAILLGLHAYIVAGAIIQTKKLSFIHESSVAIIFGGLVAFMFREIFGQNFSDLI